MISSLSCILSRFSARVSDSLSFDNLNIKSIGSGNFQHTSKVHASERYLGEIKIVHKI